LTKRTVLTERTVLDEKGRKGGKGTVLTVKGRRREEEKGQF